MIMLGDTKVNRKGSWKVIIDCAENMSAIVHSNISGRTIGRPNSLHMAIKQQRVQLALRRDVFAQFNEGHGRQIGPLSRQGEAFRAAKEVTFSSSQYGHPCNLMRTNEILLTELRIQLLEVLVEAEIKILSQV